MLTPLVTNRKMWLKHCPQIVYRPPVGPRCSAFQSVSLSRSLSHTTSKQAPIAVIGLHEHANISSVRTASIQPKMHLRNLHKIQSTNTLPRYVLPFASSAQMHYGFPNGGANWQQISLSWGWSAGQEALVPGHHAARSHGGRTGVGLISTGVKTKAFLIVANYHRLYPA